MDFNDEKKVVKSYVLVAFAEVVLLISLILVGLIFID